MSEIRKTSNASNYASNQHQRDKRKIGWWRPGSLHIPALQFQSGFYITQFLTNVYGLLATKTLKVAILGFFLSQTLLACVPAYSSRVWFFVIPWTVAHQAPLSMGFSKQEYWSGLSCPPPGDLPDPGIEPASPALAGGFFTSWATGEALF